MNTLNLTKRLISIPSFVDQKNNEREIGEFLYGYLKDIPWLTVRKQMVDKRRFNIIAYDKYPTRVIVCNHIDTVQPHAGWLTNPCEATAKNGKLYGLGSSDTKGNVATLIKAIEEAGPTKGLMLILYIDEEYDFAGAKKFIEKYKEKLKPRIIASADGGSQMLGNACRGLIEIIFTVKGKAGHAANPENGKNAISGSIKALNELEQKLKVFKTKELGSCSTNLAWIEGGQGKSGEELGREGNVIPDFAKFGFEIRNPNPKLNANLVIKLFKEETNKLGLSLIDYKIRHDLGAWITQKDKLKSVEELADIPTYIDASTYGYVDLQMFWEAFQKPVCFTYGVGQEDMAHKPNEYIKINNLEKGVNFWTAFIKENCSVQ